jgi:hypothetical protein
MAEHRGFVFVSRLTFSPALCPLPLFGNYQAGKAQLEAVASGTNA